MHAEGPESTAELPCSGVACGCSRNYVTTAGAHTSSLATSGANSASSSPHYHSLPVMSLMKFTWTERWAGQVCCRRRRML